MKFCCKDFTMAIAKRDVRIEDCIGEVKFKVGEMMTGREIHFCPFCGKKITIDFGGDVE